MTRLISLLIITMSFTQIMAQFPGEPRTKHQWKREAKNHECIETNAYTPEERLKFYPFDTSTVVKIVSFNSEDSVFWHTLPVTGGEIDFSRITEVKILDSYQINNLTNILYNVAFKGRIFTLEGRGCYNPRNAILFFDSAGHLLEYIELCFECEGSRISSKKISLGDLCNQKFTLLQNLFLNAGIEIGTIRVR